MNLHNHITELAEREPSRPAMVVCDKEGATLRTLTYGELPQEIARAAAGLAEMGLTPGERVALALESPAEHLVVSWAAWASGISVVPLDSKRDTKELEEFKLRASGARMVLRELPEGKGEAAWMQGDEHEALVLFTSGTTAHPKGARLTLNNLLTNAQSIVQWLAVTKKDRFAVVLPLHHINSTTFCLSTLLAGGTVVVPPGYSNANFWQMCAQTGATYTSVVMSIVFDQLNRKEEFAAAKSSLKLSRIQIGSAPVVASAAEEFVNTYDIPLYQGYGQTETALRVTGVPMDLPAELYRQCVADNSIGTPMSWAEVEVVDERGAIRGEGQEGEVAVRGNAVMQGYIGGDPSTTFRINKEAFQNGYFLTGDIGRWRMVEGRRFFYLTGRKKEILIKGGVNISPVAVEDALKKVSADIEQAYVVGVPGGRYGEEVGAVICWRKGIDAGTAMRALKARLLLGTPHMRAYDTPAYLCTWRAENLPATSTGKIQRSILKERVTAWEPVVEWLRTPAHMFVVVRAFSLLADEALALYNHCWQPLTMTREQYTAFLQKNITIAAIDAKGRMAGHIAFNKGHGALTCVSICSAGYVPKPVPEVSKIPSEEEVREYAPKDPVIQFHLRQGAQIEEVIPHGRPADKSALGYTIRMRYLVSQGPVIDEDAPVSRQLIQAVILLAHDVGYKTVDALSRPGGLAAHLYDHN